MNTHVLVDDDDSVASISILECLSKWRVNEIWRQVTHGNNSFEWRNFLLADCLARFRCLTVIHSTTTLRES